jgi:mono/diheme cytochrome c family protein
MSLPQPLRRCLALAAGLTGLLVAACDPEPPRPELHFTLSANSKQLLADAPAAQDQLLGTLGMLFGSPSHPSYALPEEWVDDDRNPNQAWSEFSEDRQAELVAANKKAFAKAIAHIEKGEFALVEPAREALDLQDAWAGIRSGYDELAVQVAAGAKPASELAQYVEKNKADALALFSDWYPSLRESAEVYRQQCLHCHGVNGDGKGSTAPYLKPPPRDYQRGVFKWTALDNKSSPRRADIYRVIEDGVNGTAMLSFKRFSKTQIEGLVDYVRLLSIRGDVERRLAADCEPDEGFMIEPAKQTFLDVWEKWDKAGANVIAYKGEVPAATPEVIEHGRVLYNDATGANCVSCHGLLGHGDGVSSKEANPADPTGEQITKKDDWLNPLLPRDLTSGIYRGGDRPIDIYRRLYAGINGTYMPAHSTIKDPQGNRKVTDEDLWAIVHYVRSLAVGKRF